MTATNDPRPTKRHRRSKAEVAAIKAAMYDLLANDHPMTVRQVFYRMTVIGQIPKTQNGYTSVGRWLVQMRCDGTIPFGWITDATRWQRKPKSYPSLASAVEDMAQSYRRSLWQQLPCYVEIWSESDALAGVLYEEPAHWDVPLMVGRGFASTTFLHSAAEAIQYLGKPTYLYLFGDYDPSGVAIAKHVQGRIQEWAPASEVHSERVAVTPEQIEALHLPT